MWRETRTTKSHMAPEICEETWWWQQQQQYKDQGKGLIKPKMTKENSPNRGGYCVILIQFHKLLSTPTLSCIMVAFYS